MREYEINEAFVSFRLFIRICRFIINYNYIQMNENKKCITAWNHAKLAIQNTKKKIKQFWNESKVKEWEEEVKNIFICFILHLRHDDFLFACLATENSEIIFSWITLIFNACRCHAIKFNWWNFHFNKWKTCGWFFAMPCHTISYISTELYRKMKKSNEM